MSISLDTCDPPGTVDFGKFLASGKAVGFLKRFREIYAPPNFSSVASTFSELVGLFSAVASPAAAFPRLNPAPKRRDFADFADSDYILS